MNEKELLAEMARRDYLLAKAKLRMALIAACPVKLVEVVETHSGRRYLINRIVPRYTEDGSEGYRLWGYGVDPSGRMFAPPPVELDIGEIVR